MTSPVQSDLTVVRYAEAEVPTEYGHFRILVYREPTLGGGTQVPLAPVEHVAVIRGDLAGQEGVHVRVHSECLTGEVLHSLKCDCREQLDLALRHIAERDLGAVLYLRQEGRGIGLGNKIRAYALQQKGLDTLDANTTLGFAADERRYGVAASMLRDLDVRSVHLLTNNPAKVDGLTAEGITVVGHLPVRVLPNEHNRDYLSTKRARMGHWLGGSIDEQFDAE
ncbi:MAG: GTP cyclohydrolase II [Sandaracinaceae bacterium]